MKNNLYVVYDNLGRRYGQCYAFPSDGYALVELRPLFTVKNRQTGVIDEQTTKSNLSRYEVCNVGSIDIETGSIVASSPVRLSWSDTPYIETEAQKEATTLPLGSAPSVPSAFVKK